jgi:hypothetical protein
MDFGIVQSLHFSFFLFFFFGHGSINDAHHKRKTKELWATPQPINMNCNALGIIPYKHPIS